MNTYQTVERALTYYPATRSDDRKLIMTVWWLQDPYYDKDFKNFFQHKALMPETITRVRRKIQEGGRLLATKEVEEKRYKNFVDAKHSDGLSVILDESWKEPLENLTLL